MGAIIMACNPPKKSFLSPIDYNNYLSLNLENKNLEAAQSELEFWTEKYIQAPSQSSYLSKMAASNNALFQYTGNVNYLNEAGNQLGLANEKRGYKSASLLRAIAKTRITQHRFQEANISLLKADSLGDQKIATEKMLFDVAMELGNYKQAETLLKKISETEDFDYFIRLAKWYDYKDDTPGAIDQLELAVLKAEELDSDELRLWIYSNLGDFYGHFGKIEKSYTHFLKDLTIDPNYSYALKGIAWIQLSSEKNIEEAERILNFLEEKHPVPDYGLLRAEIAQIKGQKSDANTSVDSFIKEVSNPKYGDMYNAYLVTLLKNDPLKALALAQKEVTNRPTPQSYQLLSWAMNLNGNNSEALLLVENKVKDKTFEPKSLLQMAEVLKAAGKNQEVSALKLELEDCSYELGPSLAMEVSKL